MRASATATAAGVLAACCVTAAALASACPAGFSLRAGNLSTALATGGGVWAACEDLQSGTIAFVRDQGKPLALRKRLAANWVDDAAAYLNFTKKSVLAARRPHRRVPAEPTWWLLPGRRGRRSPADPHRCVSLHASHPHI